ncbi:hypothetical protein RISK_001028 [Rhodopirellula islandica]|uniref:Uncharacterized protein n=1 Tax=Rhodopirellula islandica TaxID=595434 RepID=A0A0J1BL40_RHOIS|nr:hypothetical protein RISK_001028 [Rhodopirellula islandica]
MIMPVPVKALFLGEDSEAGRQESFRIWTLSESVVAPTYNRGERPNGSHDCARSFLPTCLHLGRKHGA